MPRITIDGSTLRGGIHVDRIGLSPSQEAPDNRYVRSNGIDLYRAGFEGHITPAQTFTGGSVTDGSANFNSLVRAGAIDITNLAGTQANPFGFYITGGLAGTAPRVVRVSHASTPAYDSHNVISADAGDNFTTLPATGYWGEDIIFYKVGTTDYIFYSWNDSDDGDVGRATLGGTYVDTFMSGTASGGTKLTTGVPHILREGPDGALYITNGRYVSKFDGSNGANGTFEATKYDLGFGWIATDIRKIGNYLAISSVKAGSLYINYTFSSESRVTLWRTTEVGLGLVYQVPDNFVSSLFPLSNGSFLAFTKGRNSTIKIFEFNGNGFGDPVWEGSLAAYGTSPDPRSIDLYKGIVSWIPGDSSGTYILQYDTQSKGVHVSFLANNGSTDSSVSGMLKNVDADKLFLGAAFSGVYKPVYLTSISTGFGSSRDLRTRLYKLPFKGNITDVRAYFSQLASGGSAQFSIFKNYVSSSVGTSGVDFLNKTIDFSTYGAINEIHFSDLAIIDTSSFYMNIRVTGQVSVSRIEIDYQPSQ